MRFTRPRDRHSIRNGLRRSVGDSSAQHLVESFLVESHDQLLTDSQNGRSKRSGSSQNQPGDFVLVVVLLQVEVKQLLSSRDVQFLHSMQQRKCIIASVADFACIDLFNRFDTVLRKKLLRFFAGSSSGAVIAPVDFRHLLCSFRQFILKHKSVC